jgi:D-arabinose 1-dehydrogenase-like Zn-dependent alcohol dehydrogenase
MKTMKAARMHKVGGPMVVESIPVPTPGPTDVLVQVKACGMVPNLGNVLANWPTWFPHLPLPKLPAVFGLDPAGVIAGVGSQVLAFKPGDRVWVNPLRSCGGCRPCRANERSKCKNFTFNGYFGFGPDSQKIWDAYPYGGFCEYMTAPQYALVNLPDSVTFEQAARFGYFGTAFAALRKGRVSNGDTVLVNGISGTLGLGAVLNALAMGVVRILGTARNKELLQRVKQLAPTRIDVLSLGEKPVHEWANTVTKGEGVDVVVDCLGPGSKSEPMVEALKSLKRGGRLVNVGAVMEPIPFDVHRVMDDQLQYIGSNWISTGEAQEMADMAGAGTLNLSVLEHRRFPLDDINKALSQIKDRSGGFSNYVVIPG